MSASQKITIRDGSGGDAGSNEAQPDEGLHAQGTRAGVRAGSQDCIRSEGRHRGHYRRRRSGVPDGELAELTSLPASRHAFHAGQLDAHRTARDILWTPWSDDVAYHIRQHASMRPAACRC
eukprot:scaffold89789_cov18-Tisochrysis_lutea.AAC.1